MLFNSVPSWGYGYVTAFLSFYQVNELLSEVIQDDQLEAREPRQGADVHCKTLEHTREQVRTPMLERHQERLEREINRTFAADDLVPWKEGASFAL